jgi:hypothetical protein
MPQRAQTADPQQAIDIRFDQALLIRTAEATLRPLKVSLRNWVLRNQQKTSVTVAGMMVIHVRAGGPFFTVVNGQRVERKEDEFFAVAAGATLSVETGNDTVVLTVLEVQQ